MYGSIFNSNTEAAYSNLMMWESLGFAIAFAYSSFLCTDTKLYILTCTLIVGMTGYVATERVLTRKSRLAEKVKLQEPTEMPLLIK